MAPFFHVVKPVICVVAVFYNVMSLTKLRRDVERIKT